MKFPFIRRSKVSRIVTEELDVLRRQKIITVKYL